MALEERLGTIQESLESLPETLTRVLLATLAAQRSLPDATASPASGALVAMGSAADQARHTHLHPNDAASLAARPSWSASNLSGPAAVAAARGVFLAPLTPRAGSFDA